MTSIRKQREYRIRLQPPLIDQLVAKICLSARQAELFLYFVPGAREFLQAFWNFVQDVPTHDSQKTIFHTAVLRGFKAVEKLGLSPVTAQAHQDGFQLLVREVLATVPDLFNIQVANLAGAVWSPLSGPLSEFASVGEQLYVVNQASHASVAQTKVLKTVVLSYCLSLPQLMSLSHCWSEVAP
jgi:hypothetical protein